MKHTIEAMRNRLRAKESLNAAVCAVALILTGCAVGPTYRRPATPEPPAFANASGISTSKAQFTASWWRSFNDPLLERLVEQASTNNHDLRLAQLRLREARSLWTEARFDFVPTVRSDTRNEKHR